MLTAQTEQNLRQQVQADPNLSIYVSKKNNHRHHYYYHNSLHTYVDITIHSLATTAKALALMKGCVEQN
jgi:hypothetical protein